jgi:hypothetical protein
LFRPNSTLADRPRPLRTLLLLLVVALVIQLPLILNPGYYSHDELQWASWSVGRAWNEVPWAHWNDWGLFQHRPVTFNLWMLLSRWFFETPYLMHAACVLIGSLNVLLLWIWLRQLQIAPRTAFLAAALWAISPYTVHTHAWVGTLADSLWVVIALIAITLTNRIATTSWPEIIRRSTALLLAAALTMLALLAKEAALVLPAAFLVAAWRREQRGTQVAALFGSSAAVAIYLALRLQAILAGAEGSSTYSLESADPLTRWIEYVVFPSVLERSNPTILMLQGWGAREWGSIVLLVLLTAAVFRQGWRMGALWLLAPIAALVPIFPLPASQSHYAYAAGLVACVTLVLAARTFGRWSRLILTCWLIVVSFHGLQIMSKMRSAGEIQSVLLSEVNRLRREHPDLPLRVRAEWLKQEPIVVRSLNNIPVYGGVVWDKQVRGVDQSDRQANYQMRKDGKLVQWKYVPPPPPPPAPVVTEPVLQNAAWTSGFKARCPSCRFPPD